jgi:rhodanese-related sulfurtransferase
MHHSPGFLKLTGAVKRRIKEISLPDLMTMRNEKKPHILIDVREDREWTRGRIKGAIHMGKGILERDIERRVPQKGTAIVLYCGGGYRSALAAESLSKMGYRNVTSLKGGWKGWKKAGGGVVGR